MNIELLNKIKEKILAEPDNFDMLAFFATRRDHTAEETPCGTTACIAGWAVLMEGGVRLKLQRLHRDIPSLNDWVATPVTKSGRKTRKDPEDEAVKLLGITEKQGQYLFYTSDWPERFYGKYKPLLAKLYNVQNKIYTFDSTKHDQSLLQAYKNEYSDIRKKMAKLTCDRIDFFIKNGH